MFGENVRNLGIKGISWSYKTVVRRQENLFVNNSPVINQSINQSIKLYSANSPDKVRLSDTTAKSVFNNKIDEAVP